MVFFNPDKLLLNYGEGWDSFSPAKSLVLFAPPKPVALNTVRRNCAAHYPPYGSKSYKGIRSRINFLMEILRDPGSRRSPCRFAANSRIAAPFESLTRNNK